MKTTTLGWLTLACNDVLNMCFSFLPEEEYAVLRQVNKRVRGLLHEFGYLVNRSLRPEKFNNSIPRMQWSLDNGRRWGIMSSANMIRQGLSDSVVWATRYMGCSITSFVIEAAAEIGNIELLTYFHHNYTHCRFFAQTFNCAARGGHLESLKWLRSNGYGWDDDVCTIAATHKNLGLLKWLHAEGCPWDEDTCMAAAEYGNFKVLKWARGNGCKWDKKRISYVIATSGHVKMMKWARSQGCWWDEEKCSWAACAGKLEMLQWLRANGCPWDGDTLWYAVSPEVEAWAIANGCPEW